VPNVVPFGYEKDNGFGLRFAVSVPVDPAVPTVNVTGIFSVLDPEVTMIWPVYARLLVNPAEFPATWRGTPTPGEMVAGSWLPVKLKQPQVELMFAWKLCTVLAELVTWVVPIPVFPTAADSVTVAGDAESVPLFPPPPDVLLFVTVIGLEAVPAFTVNDVVQPAGENWQSPGTFVTVSVVPGVSVPVDGETSYQVPPFALVTVYTGVLPSLMESCIEEKVLPAVNVTDSELALMV